MHSPAPAQRPPGSGRCPATGAQRATGPLGGPAAGGPDDGIYGDTGVVGRRSSAHPRLHGSGQPAVVSHGQGGPRLWHTAEVPHLPRHHTYLVVVNLSVPRTDTSGWLFFSRFSQGREAKCWAGVPAAQLGSLGPRPARHLFFYIIPLQTTSFTHERRG